MILHLYFARKTLMAFLTVAAIFATLILMIEFLEQIRIFSSANLSLQILFYIAMLRLPVTFYSILPIIVVISTLVLFLGLARSSELVVTRAAGRSALRSLQAPIFVFFVLGLIGVGVLNPLAATSNREYEAMKTEHLAKGSQVFSVSDEGLWLRQGDADGQIVIRASRANFDGSTLYDVTFIGFKADGSPDFTIESASATLNNQEWILKGVKKWPLFQILNPEANAEKLDELTLRTTLTIEEIQDTFGDPTAIPIWEISSFIEKLEKSGFSARAYKMWLQMELALPLTLIAMTLIGASLTMRHTRFGNTSTLVLTALIIAFLFFFLRNFSSILGENNHIPILLAAWAPPAAIILAVFGLILHLEDG